MDNQTTLLQILNTPLVDLPKLLTPKPEAPAEPVKREPQIMLAVPRQLRKAAEALQYMVGPRLKVFAIGEALTGHRFSSIVIWKPSLSEFEQVRYMEWFNVSVRTSLANGDAKNICVVEV